MSKIFGGGVYGVAWPGMFVVANDHHVGPHVFLTVIATPFARNIRVLVCPIWFKQPLPTTAGL